MNVNQICACIKICNKFHKPLLIFIFIFLSIIPSFSIVNAQNTTVTIGAISSATSGLQSKQAIAQLAIKDINAYMVNRSLPYTFKTQIEDAQAQDNIHLEKLQSFNAAGIKLINGGGFSSQAQSSLAYCNSNNILLFSSSSTSPQLKIANDNLFRLCPSDDNMVPFLVEVMWNYGIRHICFFQIGNIWGDGIKNLFDPAWRAKGGDFIGDTIRYQSNATDFVNYVATANEQITDALAKGYKLEEIGGVLLSSTEASTIIILAQSYSNIYKIKWFGTDSTARSYDILNQAAEGANAMTIYSLIAAVPPNDIFDNVAKRYSALTGMSMGSYQAYDYDIYWLYALSTIYSGSINPQEVKAVIPTLAASYNRASGNFALNPYGDRVPQGYDIWGYGVVGGKVDFVYYGSIGIPTNKFPIAKANGPYTGQVGSEITFTSAGSNDPDGAIVEYRWRFGDDTPESTMQNPTHTYSKIGTYTVTLIVEDNKNATNIDAATCTVTSPTPPVNKSPVPKTNGPYSCEVGETLSFNSSGSNDPDGAIVEYRWRFGDDTPESTMQNPTHAYSKTGTYTVTLTVKDNQGATQIDTTTVTVAAAPITSVEPKTYSAEGSLESYVDAPTAEIVLGHWKVEGRGGALLFEARYIERNLNSTQENSPVGSLDSFNLKAFQVTNIVLRGVNLTFNCSLHFDKLWTKLDGSHVWTEFELPANVNVTSTGIFIDIPPISSEDFDIIGRVELPGGVTPPQGLVCWWPGEGDARDLIGSNVGEPQNGVIYGSGVVGEAFTFDGLGNYIDMNDDITDNLQKLSIELWVKLDSMQNRIMRFVTLNGEKACVRYDGDNNPGGHQLHFYMFFESGIQRHIRANDALLADSWMHVVATYDGAMMRLYLNGVEIQSAAVAESSVKGRGVTLSSGNEGLDGTLDEVGIYNRALTAEEIMTIYNSESVGKIRPVSIRAAPEPEELSLAVTTGVVVSIGFPFLFGLAGFSKKINDQLSKITMPKWLNKFLKTYFEKIYAKVTQKKTIQIIEVDMWRQVTLIAFSCIVLFLVFVYIEVNGLPNFLVTQSLILAAPQVLTSVVAVFLFTQIFSLISVRSLKIWSQFRLWLWGIIALLITGFIFKVPFSSPTRLELPKGLDPKSAELHAISKTLCLFMSSIPFYLFDLMGNVVAGDADRMMVMMGAFFSTLPLKPMEGEVIFKSDRKVWLAFFLVSLTLFLGVVFDLLSHYVYLVVGVASLILYLVFIRYIQRKKSVPWERAQNTIDLKTTN
jgi:PKD repeat protein/ABC-type branched-subunit amino acid transport system substrate-binding protein